ncbi:hypothetical protein OZX74_08730 [Bifidobacterium sp. ESL0798]|uniref:hypothetical protein n=1 Tax=Bifidobacterium sp. ESL0798 TaxID=2983235 RepID=UPI0023F71AC6|nr:hypothetical protein [Bifidobacterium sp. ESL0798]WEV73946.1 hypothetical protein OZX74_08730 [Bifidobacterium sp. ESL0798]
MTARNELPNRNNAKQKENLMGSLDDFNFAGERDTFAGEHGQRANFEGKQSNLTSGKSNFGNAQRYFGNQKGSIAGKQRNFAKGKADAVGKQGILDRFGSWKRVLFMAVIFIWIAVGCFAAYKALNTETIVTENPQTVSATYEQKQTGDNETVAPVFVALVPADTSLA